MLPAIKFCGLTRTVDARAAAELSADYGGVIFAGGPRSLSDEQAESVLRGLSPAERKVGVMGKAPAADLALRARRLDLDVIQMHGDPEPRDVLELREEWDGEIWAVVRGADIARGAMIEQLLACADAVLLDSGARGTLGGTGVALNWEMLSLPERSLRSAGGKIVLAGGLTPENVAAAIIAVQPDVVDVSSGVESSPGVKDHEKMRAFVTSVRSVSGA